jgi:hypothetical protein
MFDPSSKTAIALINRAACFVFFIAPQPYGVYSQGRVK